MVTTRFTYAILTDTHGLKAQIFNFIKSRAIDDPSVFSLKNNIFKAFKSLQLLTTPKIFLVLNDEFQSSLNLLI